MREVGVLLLVLAITSAEVRRPPVIDGQPAGDGEASCRGGTSCAGITWISDTFGLVGGDDLGECVTRTAGNDPREGHLAATDSLRPDCAEGQIPRPPSAVEVLATCPAPPTPTLGHDPYANQFLTGLETRFWASAPPAGTTGNIRGYPTRCVLAATSFTFDAGDPHAAAFDQQPVHTTGRAGGPHPNEAFAYTYERTGTATPNVAVTWTAGLSYGGLSGAAVVLGSATAATGDSVTMPVLQVRGAMTVDG